MCPFDRKKFLLISYDNNKLFFFVKAFEIIQYDVELLYPENKRRVDLGASCFEAKNIFEFGSK